MSGKYALIIGNTEYTDPGLAQLTAPGKDARELYRVLDSPDICAFDDVVPLMNAEASKVREEVDNFFANRKPDDLLLLYFSGHGVRDEFGSLYLAVRNTSRSRLLSTAIESDFLGEVMDKSRSRRQVLILDCCNSGAFARGTKAADAVGGAMGMVSTLQGYGRFVLTASDATQFAWEGDKVIGQTTENSLFTHFLVKGLEGEADRDGDGKISIDELYDYAFESIVKITPKQTPGKSSSMQQGEIILRENIPLEDAKPIPLPDELVAAMNSTLPSVRETAVRELELRLKGKNVGLGRAAQLALEKIAAEDDSRSVAQAAAKALKAAGQRAPRARQKQTQGAPGTGSRVRTRLMEEWGRLQTTLAGTGIPLAGWLGLGVLVLLFGVYSIARLAASPPAPISTPTVPAMPTRLIPTTTELPVLPLRSSEPSPTGTAPPTVPSPTETLTATATPYPTEITVSMGAVMVLVPAGDFQMGAVLRDTSADPDEKPLHTVYLDGFYIDKFEVSNGNYEACVDSGTCQRPKQSGSGNRAGITYYGNLRFRTYPVIWVNWQMARTYCEWRGARLPTEAEWEKAAGWDQKTQKKHIYPWGDQAPDGTQANYRFRFAEQDTSPVDEYSSGASSYGIQNMAGNVWEWVADLYSGTYYSGSPKHNPPGYDKGATYIVRGGGWDSEEIELRTSYRRELQGGFFNRSIGFRCASSLPQP